MKYRALIIDDDPEICESVGHILDSLAHEHDAAGSQEEARELLRGGPYTYILLDLEIPVRAGGGFARPVNGENLLTEIRSAPATCETPVIVMTAHGTDGPKLAVRLMKKGAVDFVNKPFDGDALDRAILEAIAKRERRGGARRSRPDPPEPDREFTGGELVFYHDRVELCGVTVVSAGRSCQMWTILEALTQRLDGRRYKALPGSALADLVDGMGGQGSVAGSVRDFRRHVAELLGRELRLKVQPNDVIETAKAGYRLNAHIVVRDLRNTGSSPPRNARLNGSPDPAITGSDERVTGPDSRANTRSGERVCEGLDDPANEKREQILALIRGGARLRVPGFAEKLRCSFATAKREVDALKVEGRIEFVGPAKTGYYTLTETAAV